VHPTGSVTVFTGSHSHGQGHETTFAQLVADGLGVPIENDEIVHGDSDKIPYSMGTYGSRSAAVGGAAIVKAMDKVIAKGRKIAAHLLEASEADVEFRDGKFTVAGTDRSKTLDEIALRVPSRKAAVASLRPMLRREKSRARDRRRQRGSMP
jgi:aerobic carbon-monoxide dehydrogenase large subunit